MNKYFVRSLVKGATAAARRLIAGAVAANFAPAALTDGVSTDRSQLVNVTAKSTTGTSFQFKVWLYSDTAGIWTIDTGVGTVTVASAIADEWETTIGGVANSADIARIVINGVNFDYIVQAGDTTDLIAAGLADAINLGSVEYWYTVPGGTADAGDTYRTTVNAVNYDYVAAGGETVAQLCTGIAGVLAGCPAYTVTDLTTFVGFEATAPGVSPAVTVSLPVDVGGNATYAATQVIDGVVASTDATAADVASVVTTTSNVVGVPGILALTSSYTFDPGGNSTAISVNTTPASSIDSVTKSFDPKGANKLYVEVLTFTGSGETADVWAESASLEG